MGIPMSQSRMPLHRLFLLCQCTGRQRGGLRRVAPRAACAHGTPFDNEAPWVPSARYPDPRLRDLDPSFARYRLMNAPVEKLAGGTRWGEGPVWFGDRRCLLWSDVPNNRMLRWDEETGRGHHLPHALELRQRQHARPPGAAGHLRAPDARRVTRTEHDGAITVLADRFEGKRLNSPERRGGEVRRLDLVHRPALRHPGRLRGPQAASRNCRTHVYRLRSARRPLRGGGERHRRPERPRLLARRDRCSTSSRAGRTPARRSVAYDVVGRTAALEQRRDAHRCRSPAARRTASAWTWTAISGAAGAWATAELDGVRVFNPDGRADRPHRPAGALRQPLLRRAATGTGCSWPASQSLYALYVNTRGVSYARGQSARRRSSTRTGPPSPLKTGAPPSCETPVMRCSPLS